MNKKGREHLLKKLSHHSSVSLSATLTDYCFLLCNTFLYVLLKPPTTHLAGIFANHIRNLSGTSKCAKYRVLHRVLDFTSHSGLGLFPVDPLSRTKMAAF